MRRECRRYRCTHVDAIRLITRCAKRSTSDNESICSVFSLVTLACNPKDLFDIVLLSVHKVTGVPLLFRILATLLPIWLMKYWSGRKILL